MCLLIIMYVVERKHTHVICDMCVIVGATLLTVMRRTVIMTLFQARIKQYYIYTH